MKKQIEIDNKGNIYLQDDEKRNIVIAHNDDTNTIAQKLTKLHDTEISTIKQIVDNYGDKIPQLFQQFFINGFLPHQKNIVKGSISNIKGDVIIGDRIVITYDKIHWKLNTLPPIDTDEIIGRKEDIDNIHQLLDKSQKIVLVNGIGGIGKTVVAKLYTNKYLEHYDYVAWVNVENGELKKAFVTNHELLDNINLKLEQSEANFFDRNFSRIINYLSKLKGNNLLIIDNVDTTINTVFDQISLKPYWKVLVTSRNQLNNFTPYPLGFLTRENAKKLFLLHYKGDYNDKELFELFKIIGYHTLTIELIAKTLEINYDLTGIQQIINILENQQLNSDELKVAIELSSSDEEVMIYTHLMKIFKLTGLADEEKKILGRFSIMPSFDIHGKDLNMLLEGTYLKSPVNSLNQLVKKGWINNSKRHFFRCHQIIQEVIRYKIPPTFDRHKNYIMFLFLSHPKNILNYNYRIKILPFQEALIKYIPETEIKSMALEPALTYLKTGNLSKSREIINHLLSTNNNKQTQLIGLVANGDVLIEEGKVEKAINTYKKVIQSNEVSFNLKMTTLRKLGDLYNQIDNYDDAIIIYSKREKLTDDYESNTVEWNGKKNKVNYYRAINYLGLGWAWKEKNKNNKALKYLKNTIFLIDRIFKNSTNNTLVDISSETLKKDLGVCYSIIGDIYLENGDLENAKYYFLKDLELTREKCENAPEVEEYSRELAVSYSKIGDIHLKEKDYNQALKVYLKVSRLFESLCLRNKNSIRLQDYLWRSYTDVGLVYGMLQNDEKMTLYRNKIYDKLKFLYENNPNSQEYLNSMIEMTYTSFLLEKEANNYEKLYDSANELIKLYQFADDTIISQKQKQFKLFEIHSTLGRYFYDNQIWDKAIEHYKVCLSLYQELSNVLSVKESNMMYYGVGSLYQQIAFAYYQRKSIEKAIEYYSYEYEVWRDFYEPHRDRDFYEKMMQAKNNIDKISVSIMEKPKKKKWWQWR